jgi:hypothetical protein
MENEERTTATAPQNTPSPTEEEEKLLDAATVAAVATADTAMDQDQDQDGMQCPICFADYEAPRKDVDDDDDTSEKPVLFVHGPCRHVFCQSCLERHLLRSNSDGRSSAARDVRYAAIETPTLGRCPVCRQEIYLLDVVE